MDLYTLDFETYYDKDYSLRRKVVTTQQYVDDARFETIGVAVKKNDEETVWCTGTHEEISNWLHTFDWSNGFLLAHNALFDATILAWRFHIYPKIILDTLSMACAVHGLMAGGSLQALAQRYGLGVKGEEVIHAMGKRRIDFAEDELAQYGEYCKNDVELTHALFKKLAPRFNKVEISLIDMTLKMHTDPHFTLNRQILETHLVQVRDNKERLLAECGLDKENLMSNQKLAAVLDQLGVTVPMKISARTGKETFAFAKKDEEFKELLKHEDPRVQAIVAARLGVKSTLEERRTEKLIGIHEAGGALPVPLKYYGAITGRWSAIGGINLQNLPRASNLKKAITAPVGYSIVGADLSNIELRVGLAFAGQDNKLKMLGNGLDLYKDFVVPIFNVAYDEVDDGQRFIGKTSQLSLIYGTGAQKLRAEIKADAKYGKDIGEDLAQRIVDTYRSEYSQVKAAWYDAGKALEAMRFHEYAEIGLGPLQLKVEGAHGIKLPSGLYLTYPDFRVSEDELGRKKYAYRTRKGYVDIHPAKCYQNVIQALARCVMGEAMVRVHKKYPIALTIHDALYVVVPTEEAEEVRRFIITELRKAPEWLPDMPLDAEGGIGDNLSFKMEKLRE